LYNSMATTIFGPMDILNQSGRLWNRVNKTAHTPFFDVTIASADGLPIRSVNHIQIQPHCGINEIKKTDLLIIASATYIDKILELNPELVPWIRHQYNQGAHVASICTGVLLLAETGLLDGKSATLHWGFAREFAARYPRVALQQDRMFLDHGRLYCSAGVSAGMDLSLYLVEKFCGVDAARKSAKTMVLDMDRKFQTPYDCLPPARGRADPLVEKAREWMEKNRTKTVDYDRMANRFRISRRSLERRFKQAIGMTPLVYLQKLRVEQAKRMLEDCTHTFSEITYEVGYEDISFFRKLFIRQTGVRPKEYQRKFAGYGSCSGEHSGGGGRSVRL
ncbi:MAG: helix-turn-helix domain-containing protein, partial [Desulfobacterales bacterium]|nr:helix-turn-helix domain-containing protein [Desulfobacterales bacterium]